MDCYSNSTAAWLEPDTLIAAWQAMERAKQKAGNNPELLKRIKVIAISINLALLERPELWKPQCRKELQGIDWKKLLEEQLSIAGSAESINLLNTAVLLKIHGNGSAEVLQVLSVVRVNRRNSKDAHGMLCRLQLMESYLRKPLFFH